MSTYARTRLLGRDESRAERRVVLDCRRASARGGVSHRTCSPTLRRGRAADKAERCVTWAGPSWQRTVSYTDGRGGERFGKRSYRKAFERNKGKGEGG